MGKTVRILKRQNPEVFEKKRTKNTAGRKFKRQSIEIQETERKMDKFARKNKRQNINGRNKENERETQARKLKKKNHIVLEQERLKKQVKRCIIRYHENKTIIIGNRNKKVTKQMNDKEN